MKDVLIIHKDEVYSILDRCKNPEYFLSDSESSEWKWFSLINWRFDNAGNTAENLISYYRDVYEDRLTCTIFRADDFIFRGAL